MTGPGPLLNPFPFAGETRYRLAFLLLVSSAVALSAGFHVVGAFAPSLAAVEDCLRAEAMPVLSRAAAEAAPELVLELRSTVNGCMAGLAGGSAVFWPVVLLLLFWGATVLLATALRWRIVATAGLEPLPPPLADAVGARLARLAAAIGCARHPKLLWAPLDPLPRAAVLGSNRRPVIALSGGAVAAALTDPPQFDAMLAHELAHVANRDVTTTLVTRAATTALLCVIWPAYLLLALAEPAEPETLRRALAGDGASIRFMAWELGRLALVTGLVLLAAAAVYRARERYADLRAGLVPEIGAGLAREFARMADPPGWRVLLSLHPPPSARLLGLGATGDTFAPRPATLFPLAYAIAFATPIALLTWFGLFQADAILRLFSAPAAVIAAAGLAPLILLAVPMGAAMAPIAWRSWHAAVLLGCRPPPVAGQAAAAAAGTLAGLATSAAGIVFSVPLPGAAGSAGGEIRIALAMLAPILALQFLLYWIWLVWLRRAAVTWTPVLARLERGPGLLRVLLACAALPLVLLVPPGLVLGAQLLFAGIFLAAPGQGIASVLGMLAGGMLMAVAMNPFAPPVLAVVAGLPLAARFARGRAGRGWPYISGPVGAPPPEPRLRPLAALAIGAFLGGLLAWLTLGGVWQRAVTAAAGPMPPRQALAVLAALLALAAFPAALAAPGRRTEHGLLAAVTAAVTCTAALGALGGFGLTGLWIVVTGAAFLGLAIALCGAGLAALALCLARIWQRPGAERI
ncbi:M48 family metalloprotease [Poseidonocella sp. HB161398]|uniref:M48 family metalloprotease n=1 Tax=Poseidonocella sp. HB161398 TaxID=2320855 RepID=UPI001108331D|nr:M48 family metalloprotease [Poseidonocella sp. HB161398]